MAASQVIKQSKLVRWSPVYYGWVVWLVATIGLIATSPGQSYTVSLFFDSFIEDFGMTRTTVSALYGLGTFTASLALTWIGWQIDRYGNRKMGVLIGIGFSVALAYMSFVSGPLMLLVGFIAIRGFGQGSLSLVNTTVVAEWWQRRRGRMMSLSIVGFALFQAAYVPWLQRRLEVIPWREMWVFLAVAVAIIVIPLTWILMRNKPEDYGLLPDGDHASDSHSTEAEADMAQSRTLREAMQTPIFWTFIFGRVISPAWGTGLIIHQTSIFAEVGHSARTAAETYGMITLLMAFFSLLFGWLVDRLRPGSVMAIQLAALIITMLVVPVMQTRPVLMIYAIGFGMMMGSAGVFDGAVWANIFGRKYQGSIRGFVTTIGVAGSASGPLLFGLSYDYLGGYRPVLWLGAFLAGLVALAALFVKPPQKKQPIQL